MSEAKEAAAVFKHPCKRRTFTILVPVARDGIERGPKEALAAKSPFNRQQDVHRGFRTSLQGENH